VVEDTSKQKKETSINGNTESVMPCSNEQSKEENKQKSPSNYGYEGLIGVFNKLDINITNWVTMQSSEQRGGISFMLPNAEGKIYLTWEDLYFVDVRFVNSNGRFKQAVTLGDLDQILTMLEEQRKRTVGSIRDMLKDAFKGEAPEGKPF